MDELQSHVMPYARPRAAVATQFNVVEMPGKRECGSPASWTIESQKPCASMVLEDLSSRIARQGANLAMATYVDHFEDAGATLGGENADKIVP